MKKISIAVLCLIFTLLFASCGIAELPETVSSAEEGTSIQDEALSSGEIYSEDTTIGEGTSTVYVSVITEEKTVKLTIKTDALTLGEALTTSGLVEGENGPYGLYIKKVNGISAVYETDNAYWSLSENGVASVTGADAIEITDGAQYELTYTVM